MRLWVCGSVCLCVCLSVRLCVCVCLSVSVSVCRSLHLSVSPEKRGRETKRKTKRERETESENERERETKGWMNIDMNGMQSIIWGCIRRTTRTRPHKMNNSLILAAGETQQVQNFLAGPNTETPPTSLVFGVSATLTYSKSLPNPSQRRLRINPQQQPMNPL